MDKGNTTGRQNQSLIKYFPTVRAENFTLDLKNFLLLQTNDICVFCLFVSFPNGGFN